MFKFNKMFFIVILSLSVGFSCLPFSPVTSTAQAGCGGSGGEKNLGDDVIASDQVGQSAPSGTMITASEACEAINRKPQVSRDQFIDKSLQSAMNYMDKHSSVKPEKKKKEKGLGPLGQRLGEVVVMLLIENPELNPKQALILAIFFAANQDLWEIP